MNPDTQASTSRLPPLQLSTSQVAFDDRAAAAALLQIKLSPSSAHSPLPPLYTAPSHPHPSFYPSPLPSFHHYSPPFNRKLTPEQEHDPHIDVENDDPVRCICGFDADDGFTIQCDRCHVWQHAACVGIDTTDAAPDVYLCEQCDVRRVDYERARRVQSERMGLAASYHLGSTHDVRFASMDAEPTTKKRPRARRRLNTQTHNSPPPAPRASSPPPPAPSPSTQYVPLTRNIIAPSVRPLLRKFAHSYRGVTALTSPPLSPLALSTPLPAPSSPDDDKTFLTPLPPIHPSRPPSYTLRALKPIARRGYVAPYTCSVTPAAVYLAEPSSQYAQLGIPKQGVHLLPPPLALCLDARTAGGKTRWVRSGCRPNAVLRPVLCGEGKGRVDGSGKEDGTINGRGNRHANPNENDGITSNSYPNGEAGAGDDASDAEHRSGGEEEVTFGVFALRDLKAHEEIVLGWEWDDRHVVHELPKMMKGGRVRPGTSLAMSQVLATLCSTFTTCACGASARGCALEAMARFAERDSLSSDQEEELGQGPGVRQRTSHERTHTPQEDEDLDLGPLVGVKRGLGTRVVGGAGGREGVRIVEDGVGLGVMQDQDETLLDGQDGMRRARKRRRVQEERDDPEEMLPPKMRKMWIKETLRVLNGTPEEEKEEKEALQSPSTAMAGLSLRARDSRSPVSPFAPTQFVPSPTGNLSPSTAYHAIPSPSEHGSTSSPSHAFPFPSASPSSPRPNARAFPSPVSPGLPTTSPSLPNVVLSYPTQVITTQSPRQQHPSLAYSSSDIQSFSPSYNPSPSPLQPSPIQVTAPSPPSSDLEARLSPSHQPTNDAVPPSPSDHEPNALTAVSPEPSHESVLRVSSSHALHEPMSSSSPPRESTSLPAQDSTTPDLQHAMLQRNPTPPLSREHTPPLIHDSVQLQPQPPQDTTQYPPQVSPPDTTPPPRIPTPPPPTPAPRPQPTLRRRTLADWKRDRERLAKEQSLSGSGKAESGGNVDRARDVPKADLKVEGDKVDERGDVGKDTDVEMQDGVGVVNDNDDRDRDVKMDDTSIPVSDPPPSLHLHSSQPNGGAAVAIDVKMDTQMDVPSRRTQADLSPGSPQLDPPDRLLSYTNHAVQPFTTRSASPSFTPPKRTALTPSSPTLSRPALSSQTPNSRLPTRHAPASRFGIRHSPPPGGELGSFNPTPRFPPPTRPTPPFPAHSPPSHGHSPPSRPRSPPSRPRSPPTRPRFFPGSTPPPRAPPRGPRALRTYNGGGGGGPSGGHTASRGRPPAPPLRGTFYPPAVERDRDGEGDRGRGGRGGR